jgi:hypothetical protein
VVRGGAFYETAVAEPAYKASISGRPMLGSSIGSSLRLRPGSGDRLHSFATSWTSA